MNGPEQVDPVIAKFHYTDPTRQSPLTGLVGSGPVGPV